MRIETCLSLPAAHRSLSPSQVLPATVAAIRTCIETAVPDPTGSRNVYTLRHYSTAALAIAAAFAAGPEGSNRGGYGAIGEGRGKAMRVQQGRPG